MIEFRTLREEELEAWFDHCTLVFGQGGPDPALHTMFKNFWFDDPDKYLQGILVAAEEADLLSGVQVVKRRMVLQGQEVALGGIACVSTKPTARRQGLSTHLLEESIRCMEAWGMPVSTLQTGIPAHYARLGWELVPLVQKRLRVDRPSDPGFLVRPLDLSADLPQIARLYSVYSGKRNGPVARSPQYWEKFLHDQPIRWWGAEAGGRLLAYLCLDCREDGVFIKEFGAQPEDEEVFDPLAAHVLDRLCQPAETITCPSTIASQFEILERKTQTHWMARLILPFHVGGQPVTSTAELVNLLAGSPCAGEQSTFTFWENDGF